jgi:hypothetical protein
MWRILLKNRNYLLNVLRNFSFDLTRHPLNNTEKYGTSKALWPCAISIQYSKAQSTWQICLSVHWTYILRHACGWLRYKTASQWFEVGQLCYSLLCGNWGFMEFLCPKSLIYKNLGKIYNLRRVWKYGSKNYLHIWFYSFLVRHNE